MNGRLSKYIDTDSVGDSKKIAAMRALANKISSTKSSYVAFGRGIGRWVLNDENKVVEMHLNWRLTSLRQVDLTVDATKEQEQEQEQEQASK